MRRFPLHALALLLLCGSPSADASAQRGDGNAPRAARAAASQQKSARRAPSPALRDLHEEQNRRSREVVEFERMKGSAYAELERRRINAGLGASEPQVVRFLLSEELLHRERTARLARLRELAVAAQDARGVSAVDELARIERVQYVELLRTGTRRISPITQSELQAVLIAGRLPAPGPEVAEAASKGKAKGNARGKAKGTAQGKSAAPRGVASAPRGGSTAR